MQRSRGTTVDRFSDQRRRVLKAAVAVAGGSLLGVLGCDGQGAGSEGSGPATVPLSDLPFGERIVVISHDRPVELLRTRDGVRARSLTCTHMGCAVVWKADRAVYACPCHDGVFDAAGQVIGGPPTRPLRDVPLTVEGDVVVVGSLPA